MKNLLLFLITLLCTVITTQAQNQHTVDSLLSILKTAPNDTNKVNNLLAIGYEYEGEHPSKAVAYYKQALDVAKQINDLFYEANCFEYLGIVYMQGLAKYDTAKVCFLECIKIQKQVLGIKNPDYAASLNNLALLYQNMGNYSAAESIYLESISIKKEVLGKKHPDYATSLNNLALLYQEIGNYLAAEPLYLEAKNIRKEVLGEKHPDYALSLNNLAGLYQSMGNYAAAEPLYLEAKNIWKEALGEKHPLYATCLNNLANLYRDMGNYHAAEPLYLEAKKICKEVLGEKHPLYAKSLNSLAYLYQTMRNYHAAEPLYLEAKNIDKEVLGEKHPNYATDLCYIAGLYKEKGNYPAAESFYLEAKNIQKEVLGEKHPFYAASLSGLAGLYQAIGNYSTAEPLYLEANNIFKEVLGEKNPYYAISLNNLAFLYQTMGEYEKAESYYIKNQKILLTNINQNFSFLSEKEKENFIKTLSGNFNSFSAFAFKRYRENPLIAQNLFNITLANKGLLLSSSNRIRDEINSSSDTILVNQYKKWQMLKEDIGRYNQMGKEKLKKMNVKIDSLEALANTMEKQISLKSNVFANDKKNSEITWDKVQEKLGNKDAAIEYITYQPVNLKTGKKTDTTYYCALVLRKGDKYPQMLSLCTDNVLSALLNRTKLYQTTAQLKGIKPIVSEYVGDETGSQVLYRLLWKPLDSLLTGKEKIYVSLSGLLNKISFNALQDDEERLMLNKYNLYFVNSTRQLAMEEISKAEATQTMALFGGINYEMDTTQIKSKINDTYASRALSSDTTRGNNWCYLQGTLTEVNNIDKVFSKNNWNTKIYTGNDATEEVFKSFSGKNSPNILHISTHGFFFPEPDSTTYKTTRNPFKTMLNPLWRSGIILAGANYAWQCNPAIQGMEDGILTAYEVANCNLRNTDLVVLSACETGLGDIKTGEGVYGLQRAFQVAGAKAVIMSLWSVPDNETTELMSLFYESYMITKNKHDSFRQAQQTMAKKYAPYYWAAFVLVE